MAKKWYEVVVTESYHSTYKVFAEDHHAANDIANELVNDGTIDPQGDNPDSYDRTVDVAIGDIPEDGDEYWETVDGETDMRVYHGKK